MGTIDTEPDWISPGRTYPVRPLVLSREERDFLEFMRAEASSSSEPWLPRRAAALLKWNTRPLQKPIASPETDAL